MPTRVWMMWLVLGAAGLALGAELPMPPQPPDRPNPEMEARRRQGERMQRQQMMLPGVPHEIVRFWQEHDPEAIEELRHRLGEHPHERGEIVRRIAEETGHLAEMRGRDPERFDVILQRRRLERSTHHLGARVREAKDPAEKERLAGELRATLAQLFDVREALRDREIQDIEARLAELKALAAKRRAHKTEIIDHRIKELRGDLDYLKW